MAEDHPSVDVPFTSMRSAVAGLLHNVGAAYAGDNPIKGHPGKSIDIFAEGKGRFSDHIVRTAGDVPTPEQWEGLRQEHLKGMRLCESPIERNLLAALVTGGWQCLPGEFPRIHEAKNYAEAFPHSRVVLVPQMAILRYRADIGIVLRRPDNSVLLIGLECDGKEFHQDAQKDADRDAYFGAVGVKVVRMSGRLLNEAPITMADIIIGKIDEMLK